jgi:predicted amidohydrolase YtcJ
MLEISHLFRKALRGWGIALGPAITLFLTLSPVTSYGEEDVQATMVLLNGKVVTMDDTLRQAEALAILGRLVLAVGSDSAVLSYVGPETRTIDLQGNLAIPGFIEGHGHFLSLGYSKMRLELASARNWEDVVAQVREATTGTDAGKWITGRGWHQEKWNKTPSQTVKGYPTHLTLSEVSPEHPVALTHASGHALIVNARAMELAGITRSTPDPPGGKILRFPDGTPAGVLVDTAEELIELAQEKDKAKRTPDEVEQHKRRAIALAAEECLRNGITTFQDAYSTFEEIDLYKRLVDEAALPMRLCVMIGEDNEQLRQHLGSYRIIRMARERLTVRAIKRLMDGALGTHSAWLLEPYTDLPATSGLERVSTDSLRETARLAMEHGFQLCTHAIGDRAVREVLDVYESVFKEYPDVKGPRWRIEHAQHIDPSDVARFSELGVIASMQPIHCTSDGPWVAKRIGEKRAEEGAYVWQKLKKSGAIVSSGTDAPVEGVNPLVNFHAAITRKLPDGTAFYPDQRMTREEALMSYTLNSAYAAFQEGEKGSITRGKLADIVVLSKDIMTIPAEEILDTEVLYTIVGGEIMFER